MKLQIGINLEDCFKQLLFAVLQLHYDAYPMSKIFLSTTALLTVIRHNNAYYRNGC